MAIKIVTSRDDFEPIEEGVWDADLTHMEERREINNFNQQERDVIRCEFTIVEGNMTGRKALVSVTPNISSKSKLFAICKAIMQREFTPEELAGIANDGLPLLETFIGGSPLKIIVKHKVSARGNTYYLLSDYLKSNRKEGQNEYRDHTQLSKKGEDTAPGNLVPSHKSGPSDAEIEEAFGQPAEEEFPPKGEDEELDVDQIAEELDKQETNANPVPKATPKPKM